MCWNDGYERKRFEEKLKKQREEYKKHGMTDTQIEEIEKTDWEIYRRVSTVFLANRETSRVIIILNLWALASLIISIKCGRFSADVPVMPSSTYCLTNVHSGLAAKMGLYQSI